MLPRRGRGTSEAGGGVTSRARLVHDVQDDGFQIAEHIRGSDPDHPHALCRQPLVSNGITLRLIAAAMRLAVDLHRKSRRRAEEI
jgi:hypothetical protein